MDEQKMDSAVSLMFESIISSISSKEYSTKQTRKTAMQVKVTSIAAKPVILVNAHEYIFFSLLYDLKLNGFE